MCTPNAVNGPGLEVQFPTNPVPKRELVLGLQKTENITEN
jgi:hypothetical protein